MAGRPRSARVRDPVISHLCRDYGETDEVTTKDARDALRFAPYKSVAPQVLESKNQTDAFVNRGIDNARELRASLQQKLHGLELQRLEIERQLKASKLGHNEGNVALRELAALITEITSKLNAIEVEQSNFNKHLVDLKAKNEELLKQHRSIKQTESAAEKAARELGEEKVRLAKKLAEVTQAHSAEVKNLSDLAARREAMEEAIDHVHADSARLGDGQRDLAAKRRELERRLQQLKAEEKETAGKLTDKTGDQDARMVALKNIVSEINELQRKISDAMPVPTRDTDKVNVNPVPLQSAPPINRPASPYRRLDIPAHATLPRDYKPGGAAPQGDVKVPEVARGTYQAHEAKCFPAPADPPQHKDGGEYYGCGATRTLMASRRPQSAGGDYSLGRTRYVGLNTYNGGASQNMATGLRRPGTGQAPFPTTDVPSNHGTTYGHYFGRDSEGALRTRGNQRS